MEVNELVEEIAKSKKYANLSRDIIERVCAESAVKYKKKKAALSEVKKEFHIVYESFLTPNCQNIAKEKIMGYEGEDILADRKFCLELLPLHISTKERVGVEKEIYSFYFFLRLLVSLCFSLTTEHTSLTYIHTHTYTHRKRERERGLNLLPMV